MATDNEYSCALAGLNVRVYARALQVSIVTIGTIFYPASTIAQYLPWPIVVIAHNYPLSLAAGALRDSAFGGSALSTTLVGNLLGVSLPLAAVGALAYWIILRTIRIRGKP